MADQHREYYRRLVDMAMMAGEIMMSVGAETRRVEDTITRILMTSGFANADAFVLRTGITITLSDPRYKTISITKRVYSGPPHLSKICDVNNVSREFCAGNINIEQAERKLRGIKRGRLYSDRQLLFAHLLATSGFAYVFGGGFLESLLALFVGLLLGLNNVYLSKFIKKAFISDLLGAAIVAVSGVGISILVESLFNVSVGCQYIIVGSLMPLVPGTAFTGAIRDTVAGDYVSGIARMIEALIIATSVALGVAFGLFVTGLCGSSLDVEFTLAGIHSFGNHAIFAVIFTFSAIWGFCKVFSCPKKFYIICCVVSALCWAIYLLAIYCGFSSVWGTFFGAFFVDIMAQILARKMKGPVTLFFVIGALPLVPGYGIYKVAYDMFSGGNVGASLTNALLIAGAVALAVLVADTLIDMIIRAIAYIKEKKNPA